MTKEKQLELFNRQPIRLEELVYLLGRDELRAYCKKYLLDYRGRARSEFAQRILFSAKSKIRVVPTKGNASHKEQDFYRLPKVGDIVLARNRQYLVENVISHSPDASNFNGSNDEMSRVRLVCLDDDAQGKEVELLWELELGAQVINPAQCLGNFNRLDNPRQFAAYLHALKWSCVSATDAKLFQSPFRAGIKLNPQLVPFTRGVSETLDSLRPLRESEESDWHQYPLLPVVFEPPNGLSSPLVHLHLQHPFVQRILCRFLAQGFWAHDLSRVTVVKSRRDSMARVIVFGRLTLFGAGAVRLQASGHLTFYVDDLARSDGRTLLDAWVMLLSARRFASIIATRSGKSYLAWCGKFTTRLHKRLINDNSWLITNRPSRRRC